MLRRLYPALGHAVVAKIGDNRVVAYTRVLRVAVCALFRRYAWGNTKLFIVSFFLRLDLVHALGIVLLTGGDVAAILVMAYINNVFLSII